MNARNNIDQHVALLLLLAIFATSNPNALAADLGGYAAFTTDYVKRGVTQSDGDPALQLGAEVGFDNGFYIGIWTSTIDISNGPSRQRDLEVNYYAGYSLDASDSWRISVGLVSYDYPGQIGNVDYNYVEYSLGASFKDRVWIDFAYSPDLYKTGRSTTNVELYADWPVGGIWAIGGGVGQYDTSELTGRSYLYWHLGMSASLKLAEIDLRVHDTDRWVPIISTPQRAKSRLVLTVRMPF